MAKKYMKRSSALLIISEIQIKTTMRDRFTPVRVAIIKKTRENKCCLECGGKGTLVHCEWECKLVQTLWKIVHKCVSKKLKMNNHMTVQFHF